MGKLKDRLSQTCESCKESVLARRVEGRYVNERETRLLIWECPSCGHLWQDSRLTKAKFAKHRIRDLGV